MSFEIAAALPLTSRESPFSADFSALNGPADPPIRMEWAYQVGSTCQRAMARAAWAWDTSAFVEAMTAVAAALPAPVGSRERLFLRDRLKEFTQMGGEYFHAEFHRRHRRRCVGWGWSARVDRHTWAHWDPRDDPRPVLWRWGESYARVFDAGHEWPLAVRAAAMLRRSVDQRLVVDVLIGALACCRSAFSRSFQREFGMAAGAVLTRLRVQQAVEALQSTEWSVAAIARLVGYKSEASLYLALRRECDATPLEIRSGTVTIDWSGWYPYQDDPSSKTGHGAQRWSVRTSRDTRGCHG